MKHKMVDFDELLGGEDDVDSLPKPASEPQIKGDQRLRRIKVAGILGMAPYTLDRYLARANAPQPNQENLFSLKEVAAFIASIRNETNIKGDPKDRIFELKCRKLELDIKVAEGELVQADEIQPKLIVACDELLKALRDNVEFELPGKVRGESLPEITIHCRLAVDRVLSAFKAKLSKIAILD